jgi:hypothetical protein
MEIDEDILRIGGNEHEFGNVIDEYLEFSDFVVVLLGLTGEDYPEIKENVIAINKDGSIRWKIDKAPEEGYYDSYAGIHEEDGELYAYNLSGMSYKVDTTDGSIGEGEFVK